MISFPYRSDVPQQCRMTAHCKLIIFAAAFGFRGEYDVLIFQTFQGILGKAGTMEPGAQDVKLYTQQLTILLNL